ncbi:MAG: hypothetical protein US60_C0008G0020 [Microgenomates group bacterium GW2011_GWC1_37_8]|nr:MAG: hypothetical protein US60_C0008G0020 [Microgenomates group bacterium GW2011_GWC1_37_8]
MLDIQLPNQDLLERTNLQEAMRNEPVLGSAVRSVAERLNGGLSPATEAYLSEVIDIYTEASRVEREIAASPMEFNPKGLYTSESLGNLDSLRKHTSEASIIWVLKPGITVDRIQAGYVKVAGEDGKRLLNWLSAASSLNLGGQHPDIETADAWAGIRFGSNNCSAYHPMGIEDEAKSQLAEVTPGNHQKIIVWESSGGGVNTVAQEAALLHQHTLGRTSRRLIVRFEKAYHGNNGLAGMATDFGIDRKYDVIFNGNVPNVRLPFPDTPHATAEFLSRYEALVRQDQVAGILLEVLILQMPLLHWQKHWQMDIQYQQLCYPKIMINFLQQEHCQQ